MSISKTKRINISPKKEKDIFGEGFEVIYEGELPDISLDAENDDDYRDVLCGLSDIDHTDYIRKNAYEQYITRHLSKSRKKEKDVSRTGHGFHLPNIARPVSTIIKAGGKALIKTIQLVLRSATLILIAFITFLLGKNFLVNLSAFGNLYSLASAQDPALIGYLTIAAILLFYEVLIFFCVLFGSSKYNQKGNSIDNGRGLFSFIFLYLGSYLASMFATMVPQISAHFYGVQAALQVYGSMKTILLPLCTAGVISCILRKFVR